MDVEWFINSRKARLPVALMGRNGARVFYIVLGVIIAAAGIGFATGLIPLRSK
ncbi:MAG: hypothetical protein K8I27_11215 [Planctomycetes bacterium]|nr:hypothetical protein [Planctomycetota bacterium]